MIKCRMIGVVFKAVFPMHPLPDLRLVSETGKVPDQDGEEDGTAMAGEWSHSVSEASSIWEEARDLSMWIHHLTPQRREFAGLSDRTY